MARRVNANSDTTEATIIIDWQENIEDDVYFTSTTDGTQSQESDYCMRVCISDCFKLLSTFTHADTGNALTMHAFLVCFPRRSGLHYRDQIKCNNANEMACLILLVPFLFLFFVFTEEVLLFPAI